MKRLIKKLLCGSCDTFTTTPEHIQFIVFGSFLCELERVETAKSFGYIPEEQSQYIANLDNKYIWLCGNERYGIVLFDDNPGQAARRMASTLAERTEGIADARRLAQEQNRLQRLVAASFEQL